MNLINKVSTAQFPLSHFIIPMFPIIELSQEHFI